MFLNVCLFGVLSAGGDLIAKIFIASSWRVSKTLRSMVVAGREALASKSPLSAL